MTLHHQETQKFPLFFSALYCEEETFDGVFQDNDDELRDVVCSGLNFSHFSHLLEEHELFWEDSEVDSLISKENATDWSSGDGISDGWLVEARAEAVDWILSVKARFDFCALTAVLAANYFDRFASKIRFQRDKPWMTQLTTVACLSIAAKIQEIQVPLLVDLQVVESKYVFEAKTVQRMELVVMSTLQWRMHPVTPIDFFDHIARRLILKSLEFVWRCEDLLLSAIADVRLGSYVPSVMAAAIMLSVIKESEPCNALEYQEQLLSVLKTSEEKVNECYGLIQEVLDKRKRLLAPSSPNGVMDASFSCDSSNDSWVVNSSSSSSSSLSPSKSSLKKRRLHY